MMNAAIVSIKTPATTLEQSEEYLEELAFLGKTAGYKTIHRFIQRLEHPNPHMFVGKGKMEEIKEYILANDVEALLFDDDLSPSQLRNIERACNQQEDRKVRIYDRSLLILQIFEMRAKTAQATVQVELAMNEYLLPRLTRLWTHLERQRGGTGARGGSGEKEIETDRRQIRYRITLLKEQLAKIEKQKQTQRKARKGLVRAAIVGYTNAGKSTLMNLLTNANVMAEDKLFATVDATVRKVVTGGIPFLLSDTVGFIRKLPHHLVESFKSTLDEVREADILLHVVDFSHPFHENHIHIVENTLAEIGSRNKPTILLLNKVDRVQGLIDLPAVCKGYLQAGYQAGYLDVMVLSAISPSDKELVRKFVYKWVDIKNNTLYPAIKYPHIDDYVNSSEESPKME